MSEVFATPARARHDASLAKTRARLGNGRAVRREWPGMSPFSVSVHHGPYLLLVATGDATLDDLVRLVDLAQRLSREKGYTRVLADLISIEVLFSEDEYRELQRHAVEALRHLDRMAYTVPACYATGKPAPPALRGGVAVRTFSDLGQACQWIAS
jgi:hypothetical protein